MIDRITKITTRKYSDTGQIVAYVEWVDCCERTGRTEGSHLNQHMIALMSRGIREGVPHISEEW